MPAACKIQKTARRWLSRRGDSLYTDLMLISGGNAGYRAYHSTDGWLFAALRDSIARVEEINRVHLHVTEFQERGHAHTHILEGRARRGIRDVREVCAPSAFSSGDTMSTA